MLPSMFSAVAPTERVDDLAADVAANFHPSGFRAMTRAAAEADLRDVLPTIDVPTLILHGDRDARAPREVADGLAAAIPRSRQVCWPGLATAAVSRHPSSSQQNCKLSVG